MDAQLELPSRHHENDTNYFNFSTSSTTLKHPKPLSTKKEPNDNPKRKSCLPETQPPPPFFPRPPSPRKTPKTLCLSKRYVLIKCCGLWAIHRRGNPGLAGVNHQLLQVHFRWLAASSKGLRFAIMLIAGIYIGHAVV